MTRNLSVMALVVGALMICPYLVVGEDISADEILKQMVDAWGNVESYKLDMDMTYDMVVENTSVSMSSHSTSMLDYRNKKMYMNMTMETVVPEETGGTMEIWLIDDKMYIREKMVDIEVRMIDTEMYVKKPGETAWERVTEPEVKSQLESYKNLGETLTPQYTQQSYQMLANISEIKRLPDEQANGIDCYVLEVRTDYNKYLEAATQQPSMSGFLQAGQLQSMTGDMVMKWWIAKDTYYLMRVKGQAKNLTIKAAEIPIEMSMDMDEDCYDYNVPVSIELPEEMRHSPIPVPPRTLTDICSELVRRLAGSLTGAISRICPFFMQFYSQTT